MPSERVKGLIRCCGALAGKPLSPAAGSPAAGSLRLVGGLAGKPRAARCVQTSGWETVKETHTCNPSAAHTPARLMGSCAGAGSEGAVGPAASWHIGVTPALWPLGFPARGSCPR